MSAKKELDIARIEAYLNENNSKQKKSESNSDNNKADLRRILESMKKQGSKLDDKDQIEEEVKVVGVQNFSSKTPSPIGFSEAPTIMRQKNQTQVRNRKKD